jgi:outer membrane protein
MRKSVKHIAIISATIVVAAALSSGMGTGAQAQTLNFDEVLVKALAHSIDLKIAETDIAIGSFRQDEVRSLYFPTVNLQYYHEYVKVLDDSAGETVSAGDYVSTATASEYRNSLTAGMSYRLYDFGARELRMDNAKHEIRAARFGLSQLDLDVRKEVLETYARGLSFSRQSASGREIMERRKEIYRFSQRLQEAGVLGRQRVELAALKLAEAVSAVDDRRLALQNALGRLGYLTGESYSVDAVAFAELPESLGEVADKPAVERLPGVRALSEEIARKETEYRVFERELLPVFSLQGTYGMFGSSTDSIPESSYNLEPRDASIALVARWELFSGFRDLSRGRRLKEEIKRLQLQKEKRLAEYRQEADTLFETWRLQGESRSRLEGRLSQIQASRSTLNRLSEGQIMDAISSLETEIELLEQESDAEQKRIERAVAAYKLQFLNMGVTR